jgi:hypothetical protein
MIVNQEREEKAKIPVYLGLDEFKIVEKMGECVNLAESILLVVDPGPSPGELFQTSTAQ